ncbi:MAG: hypothetical protein B9S36_01725 [Verrucomicrobiia bacterium Tous-C2TDCM]|nr:MAG: hypothetical protein B9S36_01725 [Verrucomicrobiae bacterium Tous-C2TDCM]
MKITRLGFLAALSLLVSFLVSCETIESGPKPTGERLSSMPHNIPAPWEGQAGMPGMMSGQY